MAMPDLLLEKPIRVNFHVHAMKGGKVQFIGS